ncbi:MAG: (Fe-S)-binding protein [Chloroflexi bacterium]|nr:(Fe-S)-binding protein [Chloroflexota bacterium]
MSLEHFSVGQLMELDACTRCGQCVAQCPTYAEAQDESIHPLGKIALEKEMIRRQFSWWAHLPGLGRENGALAQLSKGIFRCTLCARCAVVCPVGLHTRTLWLGMREQMVALGQYPEAFNRLRETLSTARNISGDPNENRGLWADGLPEKPAGLVGKRQAETVYFIGCVGAMFPMAYGIPQSLSQTLTYAGVDYTTLGGEEWCCGFPLLLAGMRSAAIELIRHNVGTVRAMGAKRLVASCPSCYHTWHTDYPAILGQPLGFQVLHATQLLAELVERKQIRLGPVEQKVTYHDPCDLGRTSNIYDEPRFLLTSLPGIELQEMKDRRERSLCCGGGGDVEMVDAALSAAVAKRRVGQAKDTGAQVIVSACQQCKRTLAGAVRKEKARMKVLDITEIVWNSVSSSQ